MNRVEIDPNVRICGNQTRVGLEDFDRIPHVGQDVEVYESEAEISGSGIVRHIDQVNGLAYLEVDWGALS